MTPPKIWFRLCVDLDPSGNVLGSSYEMHDGTGRSRLTVRPEPGPFDQPHETLDAVWDDLTSVYGDQLVLW